MQYREHTNSNGFWNKCWFEKNIYGDIVAVYNALGTKYISYEYDAWGNCTVTYLDGGTGSVARKNPFRYRGITMTQTLTST